MERNVRVIEAGTRMEGKMVQLIQTTESGYSIEPVEYSVHAGKIHIKLPRISAMILKFVSEETQTKEEENSPKQEKARSFFRSRFQ